jgi:hypothetical protein
MDILSKHFSSNVKRILQKVMTALSDQAPIYNCMVGFVQGIFYNVFIMALQQFRNCSSLVVCAIRCHKSLFHLILIDVLCFEIQ